MRVQRVQHCCCVQVTATFWCTFHHDVKISLAWLGWGMGEGPPPFTLPSQAKLWCTLQLRGLIHSPYFSSTPICTLWVGLPVYKVHCRCLSLSMTRPLTKFFSSLRPTYQGSHDFGPIHTQCKWRKFSPVRTTWTRMHKPHKRHLCGIYLHRGSIPIVMIVKYCEFF